MHVILTFFGSIRYITGRWYYLKIWQKIHKFIGLLTLILLLLKIKQRKPYCLMFKIIRINALDFVHIMPLHKQRLDKVLESHLPVQVPSLPKPGNLAMPLREPP